MGMAPRAGAEKTQLLEPTHTFKGPHLHQHQSPGSPWSSPVLAAGQGGGTQLPEPTPHYSLLRNTPW